MSLLNQASLIQIPSGYKEGTLYSAKPINGDGDLSFTRASNGTRINSEGLVEVCPLNLLQYSEDISNSVWGNDAGNTKISNTTTAPNGTVTADTISAISGNVMNVYQIIQTNDGIHTYSVYLKKNATNLISIYIYQTFGSPGFKALGEINFDNGTFTPSIGTGTIESVGNGWFRVSVTVNLLSGANSFGIYTTSDTGTRNVYLWGAQVNIGSTAKPYFTTTDRLNVPRLTYPVGGGCPSLLLEKQSTNVLRNSEDFSQPTWVKLRTSISANAIISPDGTQNADKAIANTDNSDHSIFDNTITSSSPATFSIYAKAGEYNYIFLGYDNGLATQGAFFNLSNGTISQNTSTLTASIESVGNGWYRCIVSSGTSNWGTIYSIIALSENGTSFIFAGDGSKGIYIWGAQAEASSYPTSLINTTSSSATRVADACFKTGISSLIGQTEGTIFIDMVPTDVSGQGRYMNIYNGSNTSNGWNAIISTGSTPNTFRFYGDGFDFSGGACLFGVRVKVALAYKNGVSTSAYVNGASVGTLTAVTTGKIYNTLTLGEGPFGLSGSCNVNESIIFPTALTNAELASLTTL